MAKRLILRECQESSTLFILFFDLSLQSEDYSGSETITNEIISFLCEKATEREEAIANRYVFFHCS